MLFVLYAILFLGGIFLMGLAFNVPGFEAVLFAAGVLIVCAALAAPITASAVERRGG